MHYSKGSFCVVPIKYLKGMHPYAQVLYMWLCSHADCDKCCFPSLSLLSIECGLSRSTVIRYLEYLIKKGLISKKIRKDKQKYNSNNYELLILDGKNTSNGGSVPQTLGSVPQTLGVVSHRHPNYTHINQTQLTISNNRSKKPDSDAFSLNEKERKKRKESVDTMKSISEILKNGG